MAKSLGTVCGLFMDMPPGEHVEPGDFVVTSAGTSAYVVETSRKVNSTVHPNRWTMRVTRFDPAEVPKDAYVHTLNWYNRNPQ
jgi:hypothetical protein